MNAILVEPEFENEPDAGEPEYPDGFFTLHAYVLPEENVSDRLELEVVYNVPLTCTPHCVPLGNPLSVHVYENVEGPFELCENVILVEPEFENEPVEGFPE